MKSHSKTTTRRTFLANIAKTTAAGAALTVAGCAYVKTASRHPSRKRIALIGTIIRKYSHAQHFVDRFLEGYGWHGRWHHPQVELVSVYVDQFPQGDLSRDREKRFGARMYPTIAEALTLGGSKLAVDGVVLIGEHGRYPRNDKGQTLYPRHRFFRETVEVFEASGRAVPMFQDKHLSTSWEECVAQVETSRRLGFPYLAGSSLPVTWRIPSVEVPLGAPLIESVCVCYGGVDSYDFHGLETAQCMSERRAGGEAGVKTVQAVRGENVWKLLGERADTERLLFAALARSHTLRPTPQGYTFPIPTREVLQRNNRAPVAYFIEHNDGFRTAMFLLDGSVRDFTYAGLTRDGKIISCQMQLPMPPAISTTADFFNPLVNHIEQMVLDGRAPYPIERTLLTSGTLVSALDSLHGGQVKLDTPQLNVAYQAPAQSTFWRA
ncbi:MAG TPA: hypothetical protein VNT99_12540 [Methylomirabilota bacterium]|nr:hypothetical protein [Methylomirabilota bacterium]